MRGSNHGVGGDKVVRLPQVVRVQQHQAYEGPEYDHKPDHIFDGVISVERNLVRISVHPEGVVSTSRVQEENVKACHSRYQEWDQEVKSEKAGQRRVVDSEPPSESRHQVWAKVGESGEEVCDNRRTSEPHLPSGEHVTQESGRHNKDEEQHPSHPGFNIHITPVVETASYMAI